MDQIDLVEPSPNLTNRLARRFDELTHVQIFPATMESYIADRQKASLDTVVMINLLEHIRDDLAALRGLSRILRSGGHALIFVPAMPRLYSHLDEILGHHRRYKREQLAAITKAAGLDIVCLRYFDLLGVLPWWLVNTLGGKSEFSPTLSVLYDRVGVPLTRMAEAIMTPPFGKNLLLVARKNR